MAATLHNNSRKELVVNVPQEVLDQSNGFALDFGGSAIKVCYLSKGDYPHGFTGDEGPLRLTSFTREKLDQCLEFLKENCYVRRDRDERPVVYTVGIGAYQYGKRFEQELSVRTEMVNEIDAFVLTIQYLLKHKSLEDFCLPFDQKIADRALVDVKRMVDSMISSEEKGHSNSLTPEGAREELDRKYSRKEAVDKCVLASFGSAWATMKVGFYGDGKYTYTNMTTLAGRSFLGLGCLLTGAKDYYELMELAEKGNNLNVDMSEQDAMATTEDSKDSSGAGVYSDWKEDLSADRPVFLWGKAVGKKLSDFTREDIARTLVYTFCHHVAITAYDSLVIAGAKHIFLAGGFCTHPFVQKIVTDEFEYRKWFLVTCADDLNGDYHLHLLQYGGHFGALGAFLKGAELSDKSKTTK